MDIFDYKPKGKLLASHLLSLGDYSAVEIYEIILHAQKLKKLYLAGKKHTLLKNKTLALLFSLPSARTKASFFQAALQLGAQPLFLDTAHFEKAKEIPQDNARVLAGLGIDALIVRTASQETLEQYAQVSALPVINAMTREFHPCQALADMLTAYEVFGQLSGLTIAYVGNPSCVLNSLITCAAKLGITINICCPHTQPDAQLLQEGNKFTSITLFDDPKNAVKDAHIIYSENPARFGDTDYPKEFCITDQLFALAKKEAVFMHCLPAMRETDVSSDILASSRSLVLVQTQNRLHVQKALLSLLLQKK